MKLNGYFADFGFGEHSMPWNWSGNSGDMVLYWLMGYQLDFVMLITGNLSILQGAKRA